MQAFCSLIGRSQVSQSVSRVKAGDMWTMRVAVYAVLTILCTRATIFNVNVAAILWLLPVATEVSCFKERRARV